MGSHAQGKPVRGESLSGMAGAMITCNAATCRPAGARGFFQAVDVLADPCGGGRHAGDHLPARSLRQQADFREARLPNAAIPASAHNTLRGVRPFFSAFSCGLLEVFWELEVLPGAVEMLFLGRGLRLCASLVCGGSIHVRVLGNPGTHADLDRLARGELAQIPAHVPVGRIRKGLRQDGTARRCYLLHQGLFCTLSVFQCDGVRGFGARGGALLDVLCAFRYRQCGKHCHSTCAAVGTAGPVLQYVTRKYQRGIQELGLALGARLRPVGIRCRDAEAGEPRRRKACYRGQRAKELQGPGPPEGLDSLVAAQAPKVFVQHQRWRGICRGGEPLSPCGFVSGIRSNGLFPGREFVVEN